jgi:hypothetical protein
MHRVRAVAAVVVGGFLASGALVVAGTAGSTAQRLASCSDIDESTFRAESVRDIRSFSDAMAIVKAVKEEVPPAPEGPEGWAGVIGRVVTVRVERVLWRRPKAPTPPEAFRFSDWGWFGSQKAPVPARVCGITRMELGRRYLAPIARLRGGTWYPFEEARLRLDGRRVVGGVDGGEPNIAHKALVGRSIRGAVGVLARTQPYRAVVRHPRLDPARRWQAVDRDRYRVWRAPPGLPVTVVSGVTSKARWELYLRLPKRGGMCVGVQARPLWPGSAAPSGEGCGPRGIAKDSVTVGAFSAAERGLFAYGRAGERVAEVRVRFDGQEQVTLQTIYTPIPPGGRGRFWVLPYAGDCPLVSVQALNVEGQVVDEQRTPPISPVPVGAPDPYNAC